MDSIKIDPVVNSLLQGIDNVLEWELEAEQEYRRLHSTMIDLQHEIEFSTKYGDETKILLLNHMQEVAAERRKWKDTLTVIKTIKEKLRDGVDISEIGGVVSNMTAEGSRGYQPRVLKELDFSSHMSLLLSRRKLNEKRKG